MRKTLGFLLVVIMMLVCCVFALSEENRIVKITTDTISIILNSLIFVLVAFATLCMIFGFNFMSRSEEVRAFTAANLSAFKYYTVDSNVFGGVIALIYICFERRFICALL